MNEHHQKIVEERGREYGDPKVSHEIIAQAWSSVLSASNKFRVIVTAKDVAAMMTIMKILRASHPNEVSNDTYDDARIYLDFMDKFDGRPRKLR